MPFQAVFGALNSCIERAIGADKLKPGARSRLMVEQMKGIAQMTPVTAAGALVISFVLLAVSGGTPVFAAVLAWSAALYVGLMLWIRSLSLPDRLPRLLRAEGER